MDHFHVLVNQKKKGFVLQNIKEKSLNIGVELGKVFLCNLRRRQQEKKSRNEQNNPDRNEDVDNSSME